MNELLAHIKAENEKTAAWVAEDSANRWAGMIVEDLDHWAGYGITTVAGYERYMMEASYTDLYKSVHGIKPRWVNFDAMSDEELSTDYDALLVALEEENNREAAEAAAVEAAKNDPNGFVWEEHGYDYDNESNLRSYIVPGVPVNSTMRDALTSALVTEINTSATTALADLL